MEHLYNLLENLSWEDWSEFSHSVYGLVEEYRSDWKRKFDHLAWPTSYEGFNQKKTSQKAPFYRCAMAYMSLINVLKHMDYFDSLGSGDKFGTIDDLIEKARNTVSLLEQYNLWMK